VQFGRAPFGAGPWLQCQSTLVPGVSGADLSTVVSAFYSVVYPDQTKATWPATLSAQGTTAVTLTHPYVEGTDLPQFGYTFATPFAVTASGWLFEGETIRIDVVNHF